MSEQAILGAQSELVPAANGERGAANGNAANGNGVAKSSANGNGATPAPGGAISALSDGDAIDRVFAVRERERRQKRDGGEWVRLVISDRSGRVEAVAWDEVDDCFDAAAPGSAVRIAGRYNVHPKYGPKVTIDSIRAARDDEFDPADLALGPAVEVEALVSQLRELTETIQSPHLRALLDRLLGEGSRTWRRFRDAPAAKYYHQAYRHGLLDHTVSVAQAVSAAAAAFPGIDRDVAVTGALLHDIGKTIAYNDDRLAIDLTDAGRLQGEIPLGYYLVRRAMESIEGFDRRLAQSVLHIILSHHGSYENGSPVVPATREATLVHAMDNLGGKLGSFDRIEEELAEGEVWSRFDRGIDSAAYFSSRAA
jgi:3'-5' exoribonuclease